MPGRKAVSWEDCRYLNSGVCVWDRGAQYSINFIMRKSFV